MKIRHTVLACLWLAPLHVYAQSVEDNIMRSIRESAESSVNRSKQAQETAAQAYRSVRADTLAGLDPSMLYTIEDHYTGPWSAPAFGPRAVSLLGSARLDKQGGLPRQALIEAIAKRMVDDDYVFFRLRISPRTAASGPEIELLPQTVKLQDNGLQLKNILHLRDGAFFKLSQLRLALFQLNNSGESSYQADVAHVGDTIYVSFREQQRSRLTTILNINNFNKQDLYGYTGTASIIGGNLLNLNESLGLSYSGNLASVDARKFTSYSGFFSVPVLGMDLSMDYSQSMDRTLLQLDRATLKAQRKTETLGFGLRANQLIGNTLAHYGTRIYQNNSRFEIHDTVIRAQTYRYTAAELSTGFSHRQSAFHTSGSATFTRALSYNGAERFNILRAHAEVGDRLPHNLRYRVSLNAQHRLGGGALPSSELFYANSPSRARLPFDFSPVAADNGVSLSSTLSYDITHAGLHRGWVAVGNISPFIGLDHGRADGAYVTSMAAGVNIALGQNALQIYAPKVLSSNVGHRASGGVFMTLQAQF